MEPFEYAIKKDVRNNPIVREVDQTRQRELWRSELNRDLAAEEETGRQLRREIDTLRSPKRIEALAMERLRLVAPSSDEAVVLERVQPAEPPAKSVVARRE